MKYFQVYKKWFRHLAVLSYPIIIGQLGIVLMGVIDVMMVGKLDPANLAAISLSNAVYMIMAILGLGTLSAISPLVAKSKGAEMPNQCAVLLRQSIVASVLLSAFVFLSVKLLQVNIHWFGQTAKVNELASAYLEILNWGTFPMLLFVAVKQYSDGLSFTKPSAIITFIALGLNTLFCWILIYGNWGAPAMALNGAAWATVFARIFMGISMTVFVLLWSGYKPYRRLQKHESDLAYLVQIFRIGLPSGFQYFFEIAAFAFAAIMAGWISETALAAHQVAINVASVTYMVASGISAAGSIAVGDALGRKSKEDVRLAGNATLLLGSGFMAACGLFLALFAHTVVAVYTPDAEVGAIAVDLLYIAALFQLSDGIQCVSLGILRGLGDTRIPTIITILAYWVAGIPLGYFMGFSAAMGVNGIWFALLLALTVSAVLLSRRFLSESRELDLSYHAPITDLPHVG